VGWVNTATARKWKTVRPTKRTNLERSKLHKAWLLYKNTRLLAYIIISHFWGMFIITVIKVFKNKNAVNFALETVKCHEGIQRSAKEFAPTVKQHMLKYNNLQFYTTTVKCIRTD